MEYIGLLSDSPGSSGFNDTPAIITNDLTLTYGQLKEKISITAQYLKSSGVIKNDKAAIVSENSVDFVILVLSLWKLGAVPVPLNIRLLNSEIEELINFAGCGFIFSGLPGIKADNNGVKFINLPSENYTGDTNVYSYNNLPDIPCEEDTALIIFTSGSTGSPKGVVLTFDNLINSARTGNILFSHRPGDRWLASLPFYHIGGFSIIARSIFYGAALIIPSSLKTEDLIYAINNLKPSLASFVTTQQQRLIESGCVPNPELRQLLLGGGFIEDSLVKNALNNGWNVSKSYGASETSSFVTLLTPDDFKSGPGSAGRAMPPNKILIVDERRNELPANSVGEIAVKAPSVVKGYLDNDAETKRKFHGGIYYSGDYGYVDDEGFLFIEARREDLIISGGENIIPYEVEREILKYPGLKEACVFALDDKEWGHIAAVAVSGTADITIDSLKGFLTGKLPAFKHPKKLLILDELPKTELGKVMKGKIKEEFKDSKI